MSNTFDYVIVGAGSAGCVLAKRLTEDNEFTVCVLEAGSSYSGVMMQIPAGYVKNIFNPKRTWIFQSAAVPGADNRNVPLTVGKGLGGSSAINGMIYARCNASDFDGWGQRGNLGWSYADVLPYFTKSERRIGEGRDEFHGREGPLTVTDPVTTDELCEAFVSAAEELGVPRVPDYNTGVVDGAGSFHFTIDTTGARPVRMSAARAFLKPAMRTGRVAVRTESYAEAVTFEGRRATGVRYRVGSPHGTVQTVLARREVILSAGALNTPRLLQLSGVGPTDVLAALGVEVVHESPGVGANLVDHYQIRVAARVRNARTLNERARGLPLAGEVAKWVMGRPSLLSMGPSLMRFYYRSDPALENIDTQISFTPASFQAGVPGVLDRYPGMTCGGYRLHPRSRGWVRAVSTDLSVPPDVQPNYLADEWDRRGVIDVVRKARAVFASKAFAPYFDGETFPGNEVQSDDEVLSFARHYGVTAYHPLGTARMGPDSDHEAVLDPALRVRGVSNLRVIDASVMPTTVSGVTNAVVIMIGEKGADLILGRDYRALAA